MRWLTSALVAVVVGLGVASVSAQTRGDGSAGPQQPHPEPRVIIDATSRRGEPALAIQAAARRGFWGKAVGCYRPEVAEDPKLVVDAAFDIEVRGGRIQHAAPRKARGGKRGGKARPSRSANVVACMAKRLVGLPMPEGLRASASVRVRIAPGDGPSATP